MRETQLLPKPLLAPEKYGKGYSGAVLCKVPSIQHKEKRSPNGPTMSYQSFKWGARDMQFHGSKLKSAPKALQNFVASPSPAERTCQAGTPVRFSMLQQKASLDTSKNEFRHKTGSGTTSGRNVLHHFRQSLLESVHYQNCQTCSSIKESPRAPPMEKFL